MSLVFDALRHVEAAAGSTVEPAPVSPPATRARARLRWAWALPVAVALPAMALAGYLLAGAGGGDASAADSAALAGMTPAGAAPAPPAHAAAAESFALVDLARDAAPAAAAGPMAPRAVPAAKDVAPERGGGAVRDAGPWSVADTATEARQPPSPLPSADAGSGAGVLETTDAVAGASPPLAAAVTAAPMPPAAEPASTPAGSPPGRISIEVTRGAPATVDGEAQADHASVRRTVAALERAAAGGDIAGAELHLGSLAALLHEDSLTLLRMRAWVAFLRGDADQAERGYRRILERVPDDANAAVNVARFEAGRGEFERARGRLTRLSGRHPGSPQVRGAMLELEAMAR